MSIVGGLIENTRSCSFPRRHQVSRQLFREVVACQLYLYQMHCQGELVMVQHPIVVSV